MGGPASPLLRAMPYDPIVWIVSKATGAPCPTYVDDLAALVVGPDLALLVQVTLLVASRLAGRTIAVHTSSYMVATARRTDVESLFSVLGLEVQTMVGREAWYVVKGIPGFLSMPLCLAAFGPD